MRRLATIRGYCAVFNEWSAPVGEPAFHERIAAGAFGSGVYNTVTATVEHGTRQVGTTWDRGLRLWPDNHGVAFEMDVPATSDGYGIRTMIESGIHSMSFGLITKESDAVGDGVMAYVTVTKAGIDHISFVDAGAYAGACCWLADTRAARMQPHVRGAALHWNLGKLAHARRQAEDRELRERHAKRAPQAAARHAGKWRPQPIQLPPIPEAMAQAMRMGLY